MTKLPYNIVCEIINNCISINNYNLFFDLELKIIEICGWSEEEFDIASIKFIDNNWFDVEKNN